MTDWFRLWHGAPTDPKWRTIARRASVRPGDVWAVVTCLYDRASQAEDRGSVDGYDIEVIADALGYEPEEVERIIAALTDKAVVSEGRIVAWDKYQPKREDGGAERAKAWRESKKSNASDQSSRPANATERNGTQTIARGEEIREDTEKKEQTLSGKPDRAPVKAGYPAAFQILWDSFPKHPNASKSEALKSWRKLPEAEQDLCLDGATAYGRWLEDERRRRPDHPLVHLATYINQKRWESLLEAENEQPDRNDVRSPPGVFGFVRGPH